jgi:hypothetical protein
VSIGAWIVRLRDHLFGTRPRHGGGARAAGRSLLAALLDGQVARLDDRELMNLIDELLTHPQLRRPLRGNTRFLGSVARGFHRRHSLTPNQRVAVLRVLEKAYPHNLAGELRRHLR